MIKLGAVSLIMVGMIFQCQLFYSFASSTQGMEDPREDKLAPGLQASLTASPKPLTEAAPAVLSSPTSNSPPTTPLPVQRTILTALEPEEIEAGARFGSAVATDGETIVIGAPEAAGGRGAVHVYEREGGSWRQSALLTASDGAQTDAFGQSVAVSGETIVVGASGHAALGFATGAAYIFVNQQGRWEETQKLTSSSPLDIRFGWSVDTDGQTIAVGAPYRSSQGEIINVGSASVFTHNGQGWEQRSRLTGRSGGARSSDLYGWSVAVQDSSLAVGAHLSNSVYIYRWSGGQWQDESVLRAPASTSQFGYSVSLSSDALVVGAPATNQPGMRAGSAYLYLSQPVGWVETAQFSQPDLRPGSRFGWSVAAAGDWIAVGARESDGQADVEESGEVFVFRIIADRPEPSGIYSVPNPQRFDHFGHAVSISTNFLLVGAPGQDSAPGAAFLRSLN